MRFHDAMPRCSMFVTQPNAIIGHAEHRQIRVEGDELAERDPAADHLAAAEPQHHAARRGRGRTTCSGRRSPAARSAGDCAAEYSSLRRPEAIDLGRFLPVGAHDADAGQRLLRHRADVRQLRLNLLEALVDRAAEVLHRDRHERQRDQRPSASAAGRSRSSSTSATTNVSSGVGRIHDRRARSSCARR